MLRSNSNTVRQRVQRYHAWGRQPWRKLWALVSVTALVHACATHSVRRDDETSGAGGAAGSGGVNDGGAAGSSAGTPSTAGSTAGGAGGSDGLAGGAGGGEAVAGQAGEGGAPASDCAPSQRCAPKRPSEWSGPAALSSGTGAPNCPRDFPTLAFDAGDEVTAAGGCTCSCGDLTGTCNAALEVSRFSTGDCSGDPDTVADTTIFGETCTTKDAASMAFRVTAPETTSCAPGNVVANLSEPSFSNETRACVGATSEGTCGADGQCFERPGAPYSDTLCIFRSGDHDCPSGYPARSLLFETWSDGRACATECECTPEGGECRWSASLRDNCTGNINGFPALSSLGAPQCLLADAVASQALLINGAPTFMADSGGCLGAALSVSGSVEVAEPVTVCCLE